MQSVLHIYTWAYCYPRRLPLLQRRLGLHWLPELTHKAKARKAKMRLRRPGNNNVTRRPVCVCMAVQNDKLQKCYNFISVSPDTSGPVQSGVHILDRSGPGGFLECTDPIVFLHIIGCSVIIKSSDWLFDAILSPTATVTPVICSTLQICLCAVPAHCIVTYVC